MPDDRPSLDDLQAMMPVLRWRIYYADGSTVDGSTADEWKATPEQEVQAVLAFHEEPWGATAMHGHDRYWLPGYHYWPRYGSTIDEATLEAILDRVDRDRGL